MKNSASDKRFEKVCKESDWSGGSEIWLDKETGVNYFFRLSGYGAGLTPLLDSDGKPVVTKLK